MDNARWKSWCDRTRRVSCATIVLALYCSGGARGGVRTSAATAVSAPSETDVCHVMPQPTVATGHRLNASHFGANPVAGFDNSPALQSALSSMHAGDVLVLDQQGTYQHSASLKLTVSDTILDGNGATLMGTTPADQAIWIQADNIEVRNVVVSNVTAGRQSTPWAAGISAYSAGSGATTLHNIRILNNKLTAAGAVGTNLQLAGGGIFLYNVSGFSIAGNTVSRTYADGIHMTHGSTNGRVLGNEVSETGDDGIAVVSYFGSGWQARALANPAWLAATDLANRDNNILIANNTVSHNYWGRGISVVGGRNVTIESNSVSSLWDRAAIYISREKEWETTGVDNVLIVGNQIAHIGTVAPTFLPQGPAYADVNAAAAAGARTGHGAIEVYASIPAGDEALLGAAPLLALGGVSFVFNTINDTRWNGVRLGANSSYLGRLNLIQNATSKTGSAGYAVFATAFSVAPACASNTADGVAFAPAGCTAAPPAAVTGFSCFL
jgi:parallel beta-helix repeat protein